jgi:hypothetical protein
MFEDELAIRSVIGDVIAAMLSAREPPHNESVTRALKGELDESIARGRGRAQENCNPKE